MRIFVAMVMAIVLPSVSYGFPADDEIAAMQRETAIMGKGERIAFWAESFVGTPYDPDPLGEYVTREVIVSDQRVDCMYHVFRSVELAVGDTPEGAVTAALDLRFIDRGELEGDRVLNYDRRFQYAIDMVRSGKWGRDITSALGPTMTVEGSGRSGLVQAVSAKDIEAALTGLESGDIVFFVKDPSKRVVGEIIGHIGIIKREQDAVYLIHASGRKNRGGEVRKVPLLEYAVDMPFVGIMVSRF